MIERDFSSSRVDDYLDMSGLGKCNVLFVRGCDIEKSGCRHINLDYNCVQCLTEELNFTREIPGTHTGKAFDEYMASLETAKPVLENTAFFSPAELSTLGVGTDEPKYSSNPDTKRLVSGVSIDSWRSNYVFGFYNGFSENYQADWLATMRKLYSNYGAIKESGNIDAINARKQSILNLGWNPEIDFNEHNVLFGRDRLMKEAASYQDIFVNYVRMYDRACCGNLNESTDVVERSDVKPIYFIVDKQNTYVCFGDYHLNECILLTSDKCGKVLSKEEINNIKGDVYTTLVNKNNIDFMREHVDHVHKYSTYQIWKESSMISNEHLLGFAMDILSGVSESSMGTRQHKFFKIFSGKLESYDCDAAFNTVSYMINEHVSDVCEIIDQAVTESIRIDVDQDGNMIIYQAKAKILDYGREVNASAKLCKIYLSAGDVEGLKYEIAKQYFMIIMIDKKLASDLTVKEREETINAKRTCINIFQQYLRAVLTMDKEFNFIEYYNKSIYGGAFHISNNTLKYSLTTMVDMLFGKKRR